MSRRRLRWLLEDFVCDALLALGCVIAAGAAKLDALLCPIEEEPPPTRRDIALDEVSAWDGCHPPPACAECSGATVEFRGIGSDRQYKVCSRSRSPGHLSAEAVRERIASETAAHMPRSGRFA